MDGIVNAITGALALAVVIIGALLGLRNRSANKAGAQVKTIKERERIEADVENQDDAALVALLTRNSDKRLRR